MKPAASRCFFDSNVVLYAFSGDDSRRQVAQALLFAGGMVSVQTLNEFVNVATRKLGMPWPEVLEALRAIRTLCPSPVPLTVTVHDSALRVAQRYGHRIYDSLMIAAALEASCGTLYSEDMQHGQKVDGLTILNPFATPDD